MSRIRIVGGTITKATGGDHNIYSDENIVYNASKAITETSDKGIVYGKPKDAPPAPLLKKHFVEGWWSSDEAGDKRIKEALVGDHVYFHIKTKDIPNGEVVQMKLYDDDNNEKNEPKEKGKKDHDDFKKMINTQTNQEVTSGTVKDNKVIKSIMLENFESFIKDEADKQIELYYRCSYKTENVEFPRTPSDYLKVKGMPKIIIVNGQWRLAKYSFGEYVGPTQPKKPYWAKEINKSAIEYFSLKNKYAKNEKIIEPVELEKQKFILYYDGSSYAGGDQSGSDRFNNGRKFAEENYKEIIQGLGNEAIYLVSHSEGGAFAAGMADYLYKKGHKIGEHVLLSPDEGDEFEINPAIPSYQLQYMFFSSIYNPLMADVKYFKFRKWGDYYAVVDWVTNEHTIKGVKKSGISLEQNAGWSGVHGWTNGTDVFKRIMDLKNVKTFEARGEYDKKTHSGKQQSEVANKTLFYKVDNDYIIFNCPPIIKIK
jgi:hypothetical protein